MLTTAINAHSLTPARAKSRAGFDSLYYAAMSRIEHLFCGFFRACASSSMGGRAGSRKARRCVAGLSTRPFAHLRLTAKRAVQSLSRTTHMTTTRPTAARRPESGFLALSFVRRSKRRNSNWHLPAPPSNYVEAQRVNSDGSRNSRDVALYGIGCTQGSAAAREYLSVLRTCHGDTCGGWLQQFALAMLDAPRDSLLRGQIVGFFTTIEAEVIA